MKRGKDGLRVVAAITRAAAELAAVVPHGLRRVSSTWQPGFAVVFSSLFLVGLFFWRVLSALNCLGMRRVSVDCTLSCCVFVSENGSENLSLSVRWSAVADRDP